MSSRISFGDANSGFQAGIINGSVNPEYHLHIPSEQPEAPPPPTQVIPFERDHDFVKHGTILDQLHSKCAVPGSRTALVGLGGVGKSQLAIEYSYQTRERSPTTWIFWVHASDAARFEQSYRHIANCTKIPGRQNAKANIFQLVHDWLWDGRGGRWVLVLDNVDDAGFLLEARSSDQDQPATSNGDSQPLASYLPRCQHGSILITTRTQNAALDLVEQRDIIPVNPMSKEDALALLEKKLGEHALDDRASELADELEGMPLAIVQAAAYISQRAPRCSVQQYLEDFRKNDQKRARLLKFEAGRLRRDLQAKSSILITWHMSFNHIKEIRPSAADLLSLMSFFDCHGIPQAVLRSPNEEEDNQQHNEHHNEDHPDVVSDNDSDNRSMRVDDVLEDDIVTLRNYAFISIATIGTSFEMHSLVQLATRMWLEEHGQQETWKQQSIRNLEAEFPQPEYGNWAVCQLLFPHAKSVATREPEERKSLMEWASLLHRASMYARHTGNLQDARKMNTQAFEASKRALGPDHPHTLASMANLATTYSSQGQWDEAERLGKQVVEALKIKLEADHPNTLACMGNLAVTYVNLGQLDKAEKLLMQVAEIEKSKLGADHPNTLISRNCLAVTYIKLRQWNKAEKLLVQVVETQKTTLGADHPDTLTSMANLATIYTNQGKWDEVERLEEQVMEAHKIKLGADHPNTLISMSNLAVTHMYLRQWDEAEKLLIQVVGTQKTKLGPDHPDTLTSMANLAHTLKSQGQDKEAISLMRECVHLQRHVLGEGHNTYQVTSKFLARWEAE